MILKKKKKEFYLVLILFYKKEIYNINIITNIILFNI